jgi:hypothetical protein
MSAITATRRYFFRSPGGTEHGPADAMRQTTGTSLFSGPINMIIPLLCIVWQLSVPLVILVAYWKRRLSLADRVP